MIGFIIFNIAYPVINPHVFAVEHHRRDDKVLSYLIHKEMETPMARVMQKIPLDFLHPCQRLINASVTTQPSHAAGHQGCAALARFRVSLGNSLNSAR